MMNDVNLPIFTILLYDHMYNIYIYFFTMSFIVSFIFVFLLNLSLLSQNFF